MKAIRIDEFGGPEVMKIVEVERPLLAADEILIRVYAQCKPRRLHYSPRGK